MKDDSALESMGPWLIWVGMLALLVVAGALTLQHDGLRPDQPSPTMTLASIQGGVGPY